jgi:hypothetical protein
MASIVPELAALGKSMKLLKCQPISEPSHELKPFFESNEAKRLTRPDRVRAPGAGHPWALEYCNGVLLTLVWLRQYPTGEVLGYFFGISGSSARRTLSRFLPVLEAAGRATFRWPNRKTGHSLPQILDDCPEVAIIIDSFEQQRLYTLSCIGR